ncbi:hypothetical protein GE061_008201 [Apolygus lucorum]|uniref:G-protein coupled receptors family 2 profile 1 domain-containing protein n=1 Tax=Apolygus lucorum TaxID=248454 RepID=A0A6A4IYU1_APOLU|nr:hypothetical protein GE061_008201 [Apolygus lucorum]
MNVFSNETCQEKYLNSTQGDGFCPAVWDKVLCWPPTRRGSVTSQSCPTNQQGLDPSGFVSKKCLETGQWEGKRPGEGQAGWTNYTPCYTPELLQLTRKLGSSHEAQVKLNEAE